MNLFFFYNMNQRVKIKENEKNIYIDENLARELKKLWNIKMMVIPIVVDSL